MDFSYLDKVPSLNRLMFKLPNKWNQISKAGGRGPTSKPHIIKNCHIKSSSVLLVEISSLKREWCLYISKCILNTNWSIRPDWSVDGGYNSLPGGGEGPDPEDSRVLAVATSPPPVTDRPPSHSHAQHHTLMVTLGLSLGKFLMDSVWSLMLPEIPERFLQLLLTWSRRSFIFTTLSSPCLQVRLDTCQTRHS